MSESTYYECCGNFGTHTHKCHMDAAKAGREKTSLPLPDGRDRLREQKCDKCGTMVPPRFIAIEVQDGHPIDDPAGFMWCIVCHDKRVLDTLRAEITRLSQRAQDVEQERENAITAAIDMERRRWYAALEEDFKLPANALEGLAPEAVSDLLSPTGSTQP